MLSIDRVSSYPSIIVLAVWISVWWVNAQKLQNPSQQELVDWRNFLLVAVKGKVFLRLAKKAVLVRNTEMIILCLGGIYKELFIVAEVSSECVFIEHYSTGQICTLFLLQHNKVVVSFFDSEAPNLPYSTSYPLNRLNVSESWLHFSPLSQREIFQVPLSAWGFQS